MELATLASLNPLGADIAPLTPYQLMPFKLQPTVALPSLLSEVSPLEKFAILLQHLKHLTARSLCQNAC